MWNSVGAWLAHRCWEDMKAFLVVAGAGMVIMILVAIAQCVSGVI